MAQSMYWSIGIVSCVAEVPHCIFAAEVIPNGVPSSPSIVINSSGLSASTFSSKTSRVISLVGLRLVLGTAIEIAKSKIIDCGSPLDSKFSSCDTFMIVSRD